MGIEETNSSIFFLYSTTVFSFWLLAAVFTINLWLQHYWPLFLSLLFVAQKVTKRHSTDKISHSLLCSGILQSKISFVRRSFAGNFPLKATGVSNLATLCVSENLPLFSVSFCSRCLWFWQCCIFMKLPLCKILQINSLLRSCALSFKTPPRLRGGGFRALLWRRRG